MFTLPSQKRIGEMHQSLKRAASFLGWQLVPVRHLGRIRYLRPHSPGMLRGVQALQTALRGRTLTAKNR